MHGLPRDLLRTAELVTSGEAVLAAAAGRPQRLHAHPVTLGEGVTAFAAGDRVGVQPLWSTCGRCEYCLTGRDPLCRTKEITGETVHGGYAEYTVSVADHTYLLPGGLDDAQAAPLFCPGITAYGAVAK